eukprot:m.216804 g.216804  ORF g.216804 m.216804 type:complete len:5038 (+) comp39875_c0_seq3:78-15191(+)
MRSSGPRVVGAAPSLLCFLGTLSLLLISASLQVEAQGHGGGPATGPPEFVVDLGPPQLDTLATGQLRMNLSVGPERVLIPPGTVVYVKCRATGAPELEVYWKRFDNPAKKERTTGRKRQDPDGSLYIRKFANRDQGTYTCVAKNNLGTEEISIQLQFIALPSDILVSPGDETPRELGDDQVFSAGHSVHVLEGHTFFLNFTVSHESDHSVYSWVTPMGKLDIGDKIGSEVEFIAANRLLRVSNAKFSNKGRYRLIVANNRGRHRILSVVTVYIEPAVISGIADRVRVGRKRFRTQNDAITIREGDTMTLNVRFSGIPAPTLQGWRRDEEALNKSSRLFVQTRQKSKETRSRMKLKRLFPSESGLYNVEAGNRAGSARSSLNVTVRPAGAATIVRQPADTLPVQSASGVTAFMGQPSVVIVRGRTLTIEAVTIGDPTPSVTWYRDNTQLRANRRILMSGEGQLTLQNFAARAAGTYRVSVQNSIGADSETMDVILARRPRIIPRMLSDSGAKPILDQDLTFYAGQKADMVQGRNMRIDVEVDGLPNPSVVWRLPSGQRLSSGQSNGRASVLANNSLLISGIRVGDSGTYTAIASNAAGMARARSRVRILRKPEVYTRLTDGVWVNGQRVFASSGGFVQLSAGYQMVMEGAIAGATAGSLQWMKDGNVVTSGGRFLIQYLGNGGSRLVVENARESDAGTYSLSGSNDAGSLSTDASIRISAKDAAVITRQPLRAPDVRQDSVTAYLGRRQILVTPGQSLRLRASAQGSPTPTYTWQKDGSALRSNNRVSISKDGSLEIRNFARREAGEYTLIATNSAGSDQESITVVLPVRPSFETVQPVNRPRPSPDEDRVYAAGNDGEIVLGRTVRYTATAQGNPAPSVRWRLASGRWLRAGQSYGRFSVSKDGTLTIRNVQRRDAGRYRAVAENVAGRDRRLSRLNVYVPLRLGRPALESVFVDGVRVLPSRKEDTVNVTVGKDFTIQSTFYGYPVPEIVWSFEGKQITTDDQLSVETSTVGDKTVSRLTVKKASAQNSPGSYSATADGMVADSVAINVGAAGTPVINRRAPLTDVIEGNLIKTTIGRPVVLVAQGETVQISCSASGKPAPKIEWLFDEEKVKTGERLRIKGHALEVSGVNEEEAYTCKARNKANPDLADTEDIILRPAEEASLSRSEPVDRVFPLPDEDIRYQAGQLALIRRGRTVTIQASYQGDPKPSIVWMLPRGRRLGVGESYGRMKVLDDGALQISDAQSSDAGSYRVIASNRAGEDAIDTTVQVGATIEVSRSPSDGVFVNGVRVLPDSDGSFVVRSGDELSINAGFDGFSSDGIQWLFEDGDALVDREDSATVSSTPEGSRLTLRPVRAADSGSFVAFAENAVNSASAGVTIRVIDSAAPMIGRRADFPTRRTADSVTTSVAEPEIFVMRGQRLSIPITADGTVTWTKDGEQLTPDDRITVASDGSLEIAMFRPEDAGTYAVTATQNSQTDSQQTQVIASGVARIKTAAVRSPQRPLPSQDLTYDPGQQAEISSGQTLFITAPVVGTPLPNIEWSLPNGQTLSAGETSGRYSVLESGMMRIENAQQSDSGDYVLKASNRMGATTSTTPVVVYGTPSITRQIRDTISIGRNPVAVDESGAASIAPESTLVMEGGAGGVPQPAGRFLKDGELIVSGGRTTVETTPAGNLRLTIVNTEPGDSGTYSFVAESPGGTATSEVSLTVESDNGQPLVFWRGGEPVVQGNDVTAFVGQPALRANVGQNVNIRLSSVQNGPLQYQWSKDGQDIESGGRIQINANDGSLQITGAQDSDAGSYLVVASNAAGSTQRSIAVSVPTRPGFPEPVTVASQRPVPNTDLTYQVGQTADVVRGRTVRITSGAYGDPAPSLRWRLPSGRQLSPGQTAGRVSVTDDGTLVIQPAKSKLAGMYTVTATNSRGSAQARSEVRVHVAPRIRDEVKNNLAVNGRSVRPLSAGFFLADVGSTIMMSGSATGSSLGVRFTRDGVVIIPGGRFSVTSEGRKYTLTITDVQEDDAGIYSFVAENEAGTSSSSIEFEATDIGSPRIDRQPEEEPTTGQDGVSAVIGRRRVFVPLGQRLTIFASASGNPTPTLTWLQYGKPIRTNMHFIVGSDGSLTITKIARRDGGIFEFTARNSAGDDEESIEVIVTRNPKIKRRKKPSRERPVGDRDVTATAGQPVAVNLGRTLTIDGDAGAIARPGARIRWLLPSGRYLTRGETFGRFTVTNTGSLRVQNAQASDSGSYSFTAYGSGGRDEVVTDVTVFRPGSVAVPIRDTLSISERPGAPFVSVVSSSEGSVPVSAGRSLRMQCQSGGRPESRVQFLKDGASLTSGGRISVEPTAESSGRQLTISSLTATDGGVYQCSVINNGGADTSSVDVFVIEGPKVSRNSSVERTRQSVTAYAGRRRVKVSQGQRLVLIGTATGTPDPTVKWLRDDADIVNSSRITQGNGRLVISKVTREDGGTYVFRATNAAGSDEDAIQIVVKDRPLIRRPAPAFVERPLADEDKTYAAGQVAEIVNGRTVTLTADVGGDDQENLRITWKLPSGDELKPGESKDRYSVNVNGSLVISDTSSSDSGDYQLRLSDPDGGDTLTTSLSAVQKPTVSAVTYRLGDAVIFPSPDGRIVAQPGSNLVVQASILGLQGDGIRFTFNGAAVDPALVQRSVVDGAETATLTLTGVAARNSGTYAFEGSNAAGSAGRSFTLTVSGKNRPSIISDDDADVTGAPNAVRTSIGRSSVTVAKGQHLRITGSAGGSPRLSYEWLLDGTRVGTKPILNVANFDKANEGVYTFVASNPNGRDEKTITVYLAESPVIERQMLDPRDGSLSDGDVTYSVGKPKTASAYVGRTVTLMDGGVGRPVPLVSWKLPSGKQLQSGQTDGKFRVTDDGNLVISDVQPLDGGTYENSVGSTVGSDSEKVELSVIVAPQVTVSPRDTITVDGEPRVPSENGQLMIRRGSAVTMDGGVVNEAQLVLEWLEDGEILDESDQVSITPTMEGNVARSRLTLNNVQNSGRRTFLASNNYGSTSVDVQIITLDPDEPLIDFGTDLVSTDTFARTQLGRRETTVQPGKTLYIDSTVRGEPTPTVSWEKDGVGVTTDDRFAVFPNGTLRITNFQPSDAGAYVGVATASSGRSRRQPIRVVTGAAPQIAPEMPREPTISLPETDLRYTIGDNIAMVAGRTVFVDAPVDAAVPSASIVWTLPSGMKLSPGDSSGGATVFPDGSLRITNIQPGDAGLYQVRVENPSGGVTRSSVATVFESPRLVSPLAVVSSTPFNSYPGLVRSYQGRNVSFQATVSGADDIYWTKDGAYLSPGGRIRITSSAGDAPNEVKPQLTISRLQPSDSGTYSVVASSLGGLVASSKSLLVVPTGTAVIDRTFNEEEPLYLYNGAHGVDVGAGQVNVPFGLDLLLQCSASGSPSPVITWTDPTGSAMEALETGLKIRSFDNSKAGTYTCTATNAPGFDQESVTLKPAWTYVERAAPSDPLRPVPDIDRTFVAGEPAEAIAGRTVTMSVGLQRQYDSTLSWRLPNGDTLSPGQSSGGATVREDGTLILMDVKQGDSGEYRLDTSVSLSSAETRMDSVSTQMNVFAPLVVEARTPSIDGDNVPASSAGIVAVRSGQQLILSCAGQSEPTPTFSWTKDGSRITGNAVSPRQREGESYVTRLTVSDASESDAGTYSCVMESAGSSVGAKFEVAITAAGAPLVDRTCSGVDRTSERALTAVGCGTFYVVLGENAQVSCSADEDSASAAWYRGESSDPIGSTSPIQVLPDGTLQILSFAGDAADRYTCRVSNEAGDDRESIFIRESVAPNYLQPQSSEAAQPLRNVDRVFTVQSNATIVVNRTLSLRCPVFGPPTPLPSWQTPSGESLAPGSSTDSGRISVDSEGTLVISQTANSDEGWYTCSASNIAGMDGKRSFLNVKFIPVFSSLPSESVQINGESIPPVPSGQSVQSFVGDAIVISARASGDPLPTISWRKNGVPISGLAVEEVPGRTLNEVGSQLTIPNANVADAGTYTSVVTNDLGQTTSSVTIGEPQSKEAPEFVVDPISPVENPFGSWTLSVGQDVVVNNGNRVVVNCKATGTPTPKVMWTHDGDVNADDLVGDDGSLVLRSVSSALVGTYTCTASNGYGNAAMKSSRVRLAAGPRLVPPSASDLDGVIGEGLRPFPLLSTIRIGCAATGAPDPTIVWSVNDVTLPSSLPGYAQVTIRNDSETERTLVITEASPANSGSYRCRATNRRGFASRGSVISFRRTEPDIPPLFVNATATNLNGVVGNVIYGAIGSTVRIGCPVFGDPLPAVVWSFNGVQLPSPQFERVTVQLDEDNTLVISNAQKNDTGTFACNAMNIAGFVSATAPLVMRESPKIVLDASPAVRTELPGRAIAVAANLGAPPFDVSRGWRVTVKLAEVKGSPPFMYTWRSSNAPDQDIPAVGEGQGGGPVVQSDGSLYFTSFSTSDFATYTCTISNAAGSDTGTVEINRIQAPEIVKPPTINPQRPVPDSDREFYSGQRGAEILAGRTVLINFTMAHESADNEFMFLLPRVGRQQRVSLRPGESSGNVEFLKDSRKLRITSATLENVGRYRLVVTNPLARPTTTDLSVTNIKVYAKPIITNEIGSRVMVNDLFQDAAPGGSISAYEEDTMTFSFEATSSPAANVVWRRNGNILATRRGLVTIKTSRGASSTTSTLTLSYVGLSDAGNYQASAENFAAVATSNVQLVVRSFGYPRIFPRPPDSQPEETGTTVTAFIGQSNVFVLAGKSLFIEVISDGDPVLTYTWLRNGDEVALGRSTSMSSEGTLNIRSFAQEHEGTYTVRVANSQGYVEGSVNISLPIPPDVIHVEDGVPALAANGESETKEHQAIRGERVTMDVAGVTGHPPPLVVWRLLSGERLEVGMTSGRFTVLLNHSLVIEDVQLRDAGLYRIVAGNLAGLDVEHFRLIVIEKPVVFRHLVDSFRINGRIAVPLLSGRFTVEEGSQMVIEGEIAGATQLEWRFNGGSLSSSDRFAIETIGIDGSRLIILDAQNADAGTYTLTGGNSVGEAMTSVEIAISGRF